MRHPKHIAGQAIVAIGGVPARLGIRSSPTRPLPKITTEIEHTTQGWRMISRTEHGKRLPDSPWFATEAEATAFQAKADRFFAGDS
jgi:hypothetical protein